MKLSIVVTTWGVERFAAECLESVRRAVAQLESRGGWQAEVIEIANGNGVSAARNEGLVRATGDYLWFVDGDDIVREDALTHVVEAVGRFPGADIFHFDVDSFTDGWRPGRSCPARVLRYDLANRRERVLAYRRHARWLLAYSAVYRTGLVRTLRFEPLVKGEDSLWGRCAFYSASSLVRIDAKLYGYRRRPDGADSCRDDRHWQDAKRCGWLMLRAGLRQRGLRTAVLWDWLRFRFRELPKWRAAGCRSGA